MKRSIMYLPLVGMMLLTSCGEREIRSDIKEFIASFSLEDSVRAYQEAGYETVTIVTRNGHQEKTVETFDFDIKDASHPQYKTSEITYVDEEKTGEVTNRIIEENDTFYYEVNGEKNKEMSLEECHELIRKFFYKTTMYDGSIYLRGMYYGDLVKQVVPAVQDLVKIDEEKGLYIYSAGQIKKNNDNEEVHVEQTYSVNRLGMLENMHLLEYTSSVTLVVDTVVYKI